MIEKYHVNDNNDVNICKAQHRECEFGNYAHFYDKDEAHELVELRLSALTKFNTVSKKAKSFIVG